MTILSGPICPCIARATCTGAGARELTDINAAGSMMEKRRSTLLDSYRITRLALLIAMGAALHWVEGLLPVPLPIPGAKLGLANVVTLYTIVMWGLGDGLTVAAGRALLGSLLGGTFGTPAFAMSFTAAVAATVAMHLILRFPVGPVGASIAGAAVHNMAQLTVFSVMTAYAGVFVYTPYLLALALPAGFITGLTAAHLLARAGTIESSLGPGHSSDDGG